MTALWRFYEVARENFLEIARNELGEPNRALSKRDEWRWGNQGSLSLMIAGPKVGSWFDHENRVGGGPWEFLKAKVGLSSDEACREYLERHFGPIEDEPGVVARYVYTDEAGVALFRVVRMGPVKKFFQEAWKDGQWQNHKGCMAGVRLVPYHLPELVAALGKRNGSATRVYIVEGEKDVDRLREAWGVVATTNPGGATKSKNDRSKWLPEYNQFFNGLDVVIIPDNDEVGRDHAAVVARHLSPIAAKVRIPELKGLPDKSDISDWIDAGGSFEDFQAIVEETKAFRSTPPPGDPPSFRDPWAEPEPATWPSNTLPTHVNDMIFVTSMATGIDPGAQALATIAAVSGAAPKDATFAPYGLDEIWRVPPIVWVMIVAPSGFRKTALDRPFSALQEKQNRRWGQFADELKNWRSLSQEEQKKTRKPPEPHAFIVTDTSVERVQITLAESDRGTLYKRDELAGFLSFGRYNQDKGITERSFYLESYEGAPYTVLRIGRDSIHINVNGLTVYGCIQPDRLKQFTDLEDDGLLPRFITYRLRGAAASRPVGPIPGKVAFDDTIAKLADMPGRPYRSTQESADIIRKLEAEALDYAKLTDLGPGFSGFCAKLHGTLARLALILHMLQHPDPDVRMIDPDTVIQADRIVRGFILPSAVDFYHGLSEERVERTRAIAGWLLTSAPDVIQR
jgi:hypothetical protein